MKLPDGVIGNIQEFESCVLCSNQGPATGTNVVFSLLGKASQCDCEEQGSIPATTERMLNKEQKILER